MPGISDILSQEDFGKIVGDLCVDTRENREPREYMEEYNGDRTRRKESVGYREPKKIAVYSETETEADPETGEEKPKKLEDKTVEVAKVVSAKGLFESSKLPAKWFSRIDVNSETSVEDQIKDLQEEYAEIKQSVIDDEIAGGDYKPNSYKPKERSEKEWLDLMEDEESDNNGVASLGLED